MVFLPPPGQCFILVPIVQWKSDIIIAQLVASYYYYNYGSLELMHAVCLLCVHGLVRVYVSGMGMHAEVTWLHCIRTHGACSRHYMYNNTLKRRQELERERGS